MTQAESSNREPAVPGGESPHSIIAEGPACSLAAISEAVAAVALGAAVVLVPLVFSHRTPYALDVKWPVSGACALIAGLALLVRWAAGGRIPGPVLGVVRVAGLFLAAAAVSLVFSDYKLTSLRETWWLAAHVIIFIAAAVVFRRRVWARALVVAVLVAATLVAVYAWLQAADSGLALRHWTKAGRGVTLGSGARVFGTVGLETALGGYMAACAVLAIGAVLWFRDIVAQILLGIGAALMAGCMILSGTRTAWFGFTVGCGVLVVGLCAGRLKHMRRHLPAVLLVAAVLAVLVAGAIGLSPAVRQRVTLLEEHLATRTTIWRAAAGMFDASPVVGLGPGTFKVHFAEYRPGDYWRHEVSAGTLLAHSEYLEILAETGMLGAVPFALLVGLIVVGSARVLLRQGAAERPLLLAALAATAAMLAHAVASVDTRYPTCRLMMWLLMGLTAARWKDAEKEDSAPGRIRPWRAPVIVAGIAVAVAVWTSQIHRPYAARVRLNLANAQQDDGQLAGAVEQANLAIALDPISVRSYYTLANSLFYAREYEEALRAFDRLRAHSPNFADVHLRIGVVNALLGRMDAAREAFRLARRFGVAGEFADADKLSDAELLRRAEQFEAGKRLR